MNDTTINLWPIDSVVLNPKKFDKALIKDADGFFSIGVFWDGHWVDEGSLTYANGVNLDPVLIGIPFLTDLIKSNEQRKMGNDSEYGQSPKQ